MTIQARSLCVYMQEQMKTMAEKKPQSKQKKDVRRQTSSDSEICENSMKT